jgi:hypothetical protein
MGLMVWDKKIYTIIVSVHYYFYQTFNRSVVSIFHIGFIDFCNKNSGTSSPYVFASFTSFERGVIKVNLQYQSQPFLLGKWHFVCWKRLCSAYSQNKSCYLYSTPQNDNSFIFVFFFSKSQSSVQVIQLF